MCLGVELIDCLFSPKPGNIEISNSGVAMRRTILLSICVSILRSQIAPAAEGEIPKFDIAAACRGSGSVQTPAKCMQDEQAALDQITKQWREFKQADASHCIQITTSRAAAANYTDCSHACKQQPHRKERTPSEIFQKLRNRTTAPNARCVLGPIINV
jgi:hypothetical protein